MNNLYSKLRRAQHNIFFDAPSGINPEGNMCVRSDFEKQTQRALSYARYAYGSHLDIMISNMENSGQPHRFSDGLIKDIIDTINLPTPFKGPNHPDACVTYCGFYDESPNPILKKEIETYHARFKEEMAPIVEMLTSQRVTASPTSNTNHRPQGMNAGA